MARIENSSFSKFLALSLLPPAMHPLIPAGFLCPVRVGLILIFINLYSRPTEMLLPAAYFSLQGTVSKGCLGWEIPADLGHFFAPGKSLLWERLLSRRNRAGTPSQPGGPALHVPANEL